MTKLKDFEWFCPQPFMNTVINHDGAKKPCCVLKAWPGGRNSLDISAESYPQDEMDVMDVHHTKFMKRFREEFMNADKPTPLIDKHCLVCREQERLAPTESHRRVYLDKFNEGHGEYREHTEDLESYIDTDMNDPFYLTMEYNAPNNFCNLKCHMCGPYNSSTFAKENEALGLTEGKGMGSAWLKGRTWVNDEDDMDKYEDIIKNLIEMKLVGGETLALPQNYDMMDKAIDMGVSGQMRLVITTNATLTPKMGKYGSIFDYVPHFKTCQMNISIECWGEKNNYIRFPSKWPKIMENVRRFAEMPRTKILFATCVSSLNIGYLNEVADGVDILQKETPDVYNNFATGSLVIGGANLYIVTAIPHDIREQYLDKIYSTVKPHHTQTFMKLASYLENMEWDEELHNKMMIDVSRRDKYRGTCLTDVFPEWKPYYEKL
jgi:hypothetical protein